MPAHANQTGPTPFKTTEHRSMCVMPEVYLSSVSDATHPASLVWMNMSQSHSNGMDRSSHHAGTCLRSAAWRLYGLAGQLCHRFSPT
eukprot:357723-Chlamydomonas_euryale.AAC.34